MAHEKITSGLQQTMTQAGATGAVTALVRTRLPEPAEENLARIKAQVEGEHLATRRSDLLRAVPRRYDRGEAFCTALQREVTEAHAPIMSGAPNGTSLWLAGAIAVSGTAAEIEDLARHEDVTRIESNPVVEVPRVLRTPLEDSPESVDGSTWGLATIGAPDVWGGYGRGEGVLVGHLDTGVDADHPALAGKVVAFAEFDGAGNQVPTAGPYDTDQHGTHTAGTIVGRTHRGLNIGVAPDARLASALVLPGGSGTFAQVVAGMQWCVAEGVHVINMSLGGPKYTTLWNLPILNAWLSGVVVVASIGNSGQGTSGGPGNDPLCIGVGATHPAEFAAGFSGGQVLPEVSWGPHQLTYIKPDICAPGVRVVSSVGKDGLASFNGTSMAAPHVAGVVALLQSAEPALRGDPYATRALLLGCVEDYGEAGRDPRYGFGRVDARSSAHQAIALR
ncbi:S8 family peptidase [Nonomuraea typhae]|uniref:S8 family peptidase n=1 Tax=Nonomuraea typhae TaxID=2603600 RepID=A0ABW7YX20_9ACTN